MTEQNAEQDALGPCLNCGFGLALKAGRTVVHTEGPQAGKGTCALNPYGKFMATVREDHTQ